MKQQYLKNVAQINMDQTCIGCGKCVEVCPHRVLKLENGKAVFQKKERCMECGACAQNCPVDAISVEAGVGCALAVIRGWITGSEPSCDCSGNDDCC